MNRRSPQRSARGWTRTVAATATAGLLTALVPLSMTAAEAAPQQKPGNAGAASCNARANNTYQKLLQCITADGVLKHEQALQTIADANQDANYPGSRAAGTDGYDGSVEYVKRTLEAAGWNVTLDPVDVTYQFPVVLRQLTPTQADYESGAFTGSGGGTVEGPVIPVDINLEGDRASTSGCQAADFDNLDFSGDNDIALIQRGGCNFGDKGFFAQQAGAEAVVIFNQGDPGAGDRFGLIVADASSRTDGTPVKHDIPVVGASFDDGVALSQEGSTALVDAPPPETREDFNVIAEKPGQNTDNVVMAGAHLDSVTEGPGINDNGSGSSALLDLAQKLSKVDNPNTLRFAWWAAEEQGLVGSEDYVAGLSEAERDRIAAYLNFDMIGSPNFIYGVYDADESGFEAPVDVPEGSTALEDLFETFFTWQGIPYEDSEFSGRSDYQAFILNDIPSSGLFTGAEVPKTEEQEAIWGGVAGESYDPCYHQACDNLTGAGERDEDVYAELDEENDLVGNVSKEALGVNSDAIAFAVLTLAYSTEDVNGVEGEPVPGSKPLGLPEEPAGPEGTAGSDGGLHDHADLR